MTETRAALLALFLANVIWGLSPVFYGLFRHVPPLEVLCHRTLWSLVFFGLFLAAQRRLGEIARAFVGRRRLVTLIVSALMVSVNWTLFIWAVQVGRVVESSLGYFIFPLVSVALGYLFFAERLGPVRAVSVALATVAVLVLTLGQGVTPILSLVLALTFGVYSVLKKTTPVGPVVSVTAEVLIFAPFALIWLVGVHSYGWVALTDAAVGAFGHGWRDSLLLALAGPLTAGPLVLFSYASRRLRLSTLGLMQYINPSLQFAVAVAIFAEPFSIWHGIAFSLIWVALALYSLQALREERRAGGEGAA